MNFPFDYIQDDSFDFYFLYRAHDEARDAKETELMQLKQIQAIAEG